MKDKIKSRDLCRRCQYDYETHCQGKNCKDCERMYGLDCKCELIQYNTPCPDFKEKEEANDRMGV